MIYCATSDPPNISRMRQNIKFKHRKKQLYFVCNKVHIISIALCVLKKEKRVDTWIFKSLKRLTLLREINFSCIK